MCGRYLIDDNTFRAIRALTQNPDCDTALQLRIGDVFPGQTAPVLLPNPSGLTVRLQSWGFPVFGKNRLVFNARSESVLEKPMFRDSVRLRRCIIPAGAFYEWNPSKEKYTISHPDHRLLFLAGLYNRFDDEDHFVILTTKSNRSMAAIHPRMPLILENDQLSDWLRDAARTEAFLQQSPPDLETVTEYHQQTLEF